MKYFKNTSWLFLEKILRIFVGLFVGIWVARYLGPENLGYLSYSQSFVGLFSAIATLGLNGIVVKELVKKDIDEDKLIGTVFWLKLLGAISVILILLVVINLTSNDFDTNILIFIIASATIFQSFNVIDVYFQSKVLSKYVVFSNVITLFFSSIFKILLILNDAPLIYFAYVILFDNIVLAIGYIYFYKIKNNSLIKQLKMFDKTLAISLLKNSWPLIISGIAVMIYARIDQVMLFHMVDANEVGQYSVAIGLIEMFDFFAVILVKSLAPSITSAKQISEKLYLSRLETLYKLMMISFLFFYIPILLFGEIIIQFLYGMEYSLAASLFVLAGFRTLFTNYGVAMGTYINNENLFKYSMYFTLIGCIVNIILNLLLIPMYEAVGAIISTLISFTVTVFLVNLFFNKLQNNGLVMIKSLFTFYTLRTKDIK